MHPVRSVKLYDEEVPVLAGKDVRELEDLNGERVNVDVAASASAVIAEILQQSRPIRGCLLQTAVQQTR